MQVKYNIDSPSWAENEKPFQVYSSDEAMFFVDRFEVLKSEIDGFTELGINWDGYGGVPLLKSIAIKATHFVSILNDEIIDRIYDVFPNPHGTLTIEWENDINEKLSLEIGENNYSYFIENNEGGPQFYNGNHLPDFETFNHQLGQFFKNEIPRINIVIYSE